MTIEKIHNPFKKFFLNYNSYLKCYLCNKTLPTEAEFDNHMKTVHR